MNRLRNLRNAFGRGGDDEEFESIPPQQTEQSAATDGEGDGAEVGNGDGDGDGDDNDDSNDPSSRDRGDASFFNAEDDAANEDRRRQALLSDIERNQRSNFIHFILLCLVPTSLLLIVVASIVGENDNCSGFPTSCANEPRTFINAFTTRCICDAVVAEKP